MRAENLEQAVAWASGTAFGLTGGIQSLDEREVAYWQEHIQVGNAYINRHTTGAIVRRQPFGGWKGSVFGPGAKAGGPNYVLQLAHWRQEALPQEHADISPPVAALLERCLAHLPNQIDRDLLQASAGSYHHAWQTHFSQEHDPSQVRGERNLFRYRPCRRILVRSELQEADDPASLCQVLLAARICGVPLEISLPTGGAPSGPGWSWLANEEDVTLTLEDEARLIERINQGTSNERMRVFAPVSTVLRRAANEAHTAVVDAPVLAHGRLELRWYLREQALSHVVHRYGNLMSMSH
jgi:RHH-type proline utilization regulon transcriptional repressor/proline dehydrogenase/delta 1-pyrroline-5-carboxylate dehydrogenase